MFDVVVRKWNDGTIQNHFLPYKMNLIARHWNFGLIQSFDYCLTLPTNWFYQKYLGIRWVFFLLFYALCRKNDVVVPWKAFCSADALFFIQWIIQLIDVRWIDGNFWSLLKNLRQEFSKDYRGIDKLQQFECQKIPFKLLINHIRIAQNPDRILKRKKKKKRIQIKIKLRRSDEKEQQLLIFFFNFLMCC